jgi:hypothetical protein
MTQMHAISTINSFTQARIYTSRYVQLAERRCSSEGVDLLQSMGHVSWLISLATMMHAGRYSVPATTMKTPASSGYKSQRMY